MDGWRDMFKISARWGGGEFSFHIGTVWIAIIAFLIWWGFW